MPKVAQHDDDIFRPVIGRKRMLQPLQNGFFGVFCRRFKVKIIIFKHMTHAGFHRIWRDDASDNNAQSVFIF